jgi:hypothetical protein
MSTKESKEGMVLENQTIAREDDESVCNIHKNSTLDCGCKEWFVHLEACQI